MTIKKLIRDNIPRIIVAKGEKVPPIEFVVGDEKLRYLKLKVIEEAQELSEAKDEAALIEEIADVQEVLRAILEHHSDEFRTRALQRFSEKRKEKGAFEQGFVAEFKTLSDLTPKELVVEPCEHGCKGWCRLCFLKVKSNLLGYPPARSEVAKWDGGSWECGLYDDGCSGPCPYVIQNGCANCAFLTVGGEKDPNFPK